MFIIKLKQIKIPALAESLRAGKTIVIPTETCYGLGCDALNADAVNRVFRIKERSDDKPVLMIVSGIAMAEDYLQWDGSLEKIALKYWPGPLTVVGKIKAGVILPNGLMGPDNEVAVRVSGDSFVGAIVQELNRPLVSTSANLAGAPSPYSFQEVLTGFENKVNRPDIVIDAGDLPVTPPTTIIRVVDGRISVIRQGELKI
ncbi:MAG: L-threonylcarbamoyladenylate synthase [Patescibacteria group bacterium]